MQISKTLTILLLVIFLIGCTSNAPEERREQSTKQATDAGWQSVILETDSFHLAAFLPLYLLHTDILTIYIEGDGMAWVNRSTPSSNPTPRDPLALKLALSDPDKTAVYLARPCQYVVGKDQTHCAQKYWTDSRFASEVIAASDQAVSQLKSRFQAKQIRLVGYSGGGAVAALVAAQRDDVEMLVTVAGNLDTVFWIKTNHLSPLTGSLNPADAWRNLQSIKQRHYVGGQDQVMGESIARSYAVRFDTMHKPPITVIPDFDHHCCWVKRWPEFVKSQFSDAH
jgi:hypothetical protein